MTHPIDFQGAEKLGWKIEPRFEARKGDQVFRGTAAELTTRIAEHEKREAMEAERHAHAHREHHDVPISRLVRRLGTLEVEHQREWDTYSDSDADHHTRLFALERATKLRAQQNKTFEELFERPKEALLENADFRELQEALREDE
jgi:hypothetical protein